MSDLIQPKRGEQLYCCEHFTTDAKGKFIWGKLDGEPVEGFDKIDWVVVCEHCFSEAGGQFIGIPLSVRATWTGESEVLSEFTVN